MERRSTCLPFVLKHTTKSFLITGRKLTYKAKPIAKTRSTALGGKLHEIMGANLGNEWNEPRSCNGGGEESGGCSETRR